MNNLNSFFIVVVAMLVAMMPSESLGRGQSNQFFDQLEQSYVNENYSELIRLTVNHRHYFSGLYFLQNALAKGELAENLDQEAETIIHHTGHTGLLNLPQSVLLNYPRRSGAFVLGEKAFRSGDKAGAERYFLLIPQGHPLEAESQLYLGRISMDNQARSTAHKNFVSCREAAAYWEGEVKGKILKRHYQRLQDFCMGNQARVLFEQEQFGEAEELFSQIDKRHEMWPFLIMDRAWSSYQAKDYNRALGLLSTFKAPLIASYFDPEVEVLTAQSYFHLCLYQDALLIIDYFYQHYKPLIENMKTMVEDNSQLKQFLSANLKELEQKNPFLRHLLVKLVRGQNFKRLEKELLQLSQELRRIEDWPASEMKDHFLQALGQMRELRENELTRQLKTAMVDLINRTHQYSEVLFNLRLEILSRSRDLVYKGQSLVSDRARGNYDKAMVRSHHNFYPVHGEFWTDEFGDYSFGLEDNCQVMKSESWEKDAQELSEEELKKQEEEQMKAQADKERAELEAETEEQAKREAEEKKLEEELLDEKKGHKKPQLEFPDQLQENKHDTIDLENTEFKELSRPGAVAP